MNKNDYIIRLEKNEEYHKVEDLVRESFWNVYRPGCNEHYLLDQLRKSADFVPELDFVLEKGGTLIGQIAFVRSVINADDGRQLPVMTIGPICIAPEFKRQGYGKILLDHSIEKAKEFGVKALFLDGNIDFYGKSGFVYASDFGIRYHGMPEGEDTSFFLCNELEKGFLDGVKGEYVISESYFIDEKQAEKFDEKFPAKEKMVLPGQIFSH